MYPTINESTESAPLRHGARTPNYLPVAAAGQTFGTTYFLLSTLLASIIPIIQLSIGLYYKGGCPIDQRIATYMIIAGICGLALAGLSIFLAITYKCLIADSTALNLLASCGVCLNIIATIILSVFIFVWFILGCVWVFGVRNQVQYDPSKPGFCEPVLYRSAYILLIITIVWACLQCCLSCFRQCCTGRSE